MKTASFILSGAILAGTILATNGQISLESAPPVVVKTIPQAGNKDVDPATTEIRVTFSKKMQGGSWSWSTWGEDTFPEMIGQPKYLDDGLTCVLPVKLKPGKFYATWLNSEKFRNFKAENGTPAVPYLLTFQTAGQSLAGAEPQQPTTAANSDTAANSLALAGLNKDQLLVFDWTERQFRGFFDRRTFAGWTDEEKANLETKLVDTLSGPRNQEYYLAINTLGALRSTKGLEKLRAIAFDRREKDNRDRWMATRALGIMGDKASIPEMIHLVYHGNVNTRWWAQIALVQLTGQNFGADWEAWGKWWNESGGEPKFDPQIVTWYKDQGDREQLKQTLAERDAKFLEDLRARSRK